MDKMIASRQAIPVKIGVQDLTFLMLILNSFATSTVSFQTSFSLPVRTKKMLRVRIMPHNKYAFANPITDNPNPTSPKNANPMALPRINLSCGSAFGNKYEPIQAPSTAIQNGIRRVKNKFINPGKMLKKSGFWIIKNMVRIAPSHSKNELTIIVFFIRCVFQKTTSETRVVSLYIFDDYHCFSYLSLSRDYYAKH